MKRQFASMTVSFLMIATPALPQSAFTDETSFTCMFSKICYDDGECLENIESPVDLELSKASPGDAYIIGAEVHIEGHAQISKEAILFKASDGHHSYEMSLQRGGECSLHTNYGGPYFDIKTGNWWTYDRDQFVKDLTNKSKP